MEPDTVVFMKPQIKVYHDKIKDADQFQKNIKDGIEVLFRANEKKQLTE